MDQTVLITGASTGIGMELAGVFAKAGYNLVLVARDSDRLNAIRDALSEAYGKNVLVLPLDLAVPGAPEALVDALRDQDVTVDVLVNNAGIGDYGRFVDADAERLRLMTRVNVMVPTMLSRLLGAQMADRGRGKILNVASVAGFMPGPLMAAYYATKAHMLSLSEALAEELQGNGVTVTALCPGPTKTGFFGKAGGPAGAGNKRAAADPRKVAEYGFAAMNAGKRVAIFGFEEKLKVFLDRFLPRQVVARRSAAFLR